MEVKIAHCADVHIGAKCRGIGSEKSSIIADCIKESFFEILDICRSEKVDVLLVAGDFFDDTDIRAADINEIISRMENCGCKIVISPGNHDPYTPDSPYVRYDWPENVFIFKSEQVEKFCIAEKGVTIWGNAFGGAHEWSSLLKGVHAEDKALINICVMHGDVRFKGESRYNLITVRDIESSGMDYVALGHIHRRTDIKRVGGVNYAYSGNVQGTDFGETGEKGFYIGKISKEICDLRFHKLSGRRFEVVHIDVTGCKYTSDFVSAVLEKLREKYGSDYARHSYKIVFEGNIEEDVLLDMGLINSKINEKVFYANVIDATRPEIDIKKLKYRTDFKSIFLRKMLCRIDKAISDEEQEKCREALKIGLKAFDGSVDYED